MSLHLRYGADVFSRLHGAKYGTTFGTGRQQFSARRHRAEKLRVVLRLVEPLDEELHRLHRRERVEDLAEDPHAVQLLLLEEQLFLARARAVEVDGRENAAVDELPVEVDLHVAGPLELLEDHVIHPRARVDEGRREERERVEQDDDVALVLDEALRLFDDHLGDLDVPRRGLVERRGDDLALHGALHVRDFLGPLVDQEDDERDLRVVRRDRVCERLQEHRLARARRRDDEAALALADGHDEVEDARGQIRGLEADALLRVERRQVVEEDLFARDVRVLEVDGLDLDQREVPLAFLRRPDLPGDRVPGAQAELPDLRGRDVDVVRTGEIVVLGRPQEPESIRQHLEDALREDQAEAFGLGLQDLEDQLLLAQRGRALDLEVLRDLDELRHRVVVQRPDVENGLGGSVRSSGRRGRIFDVGGEIPGIDVAGGVVGAGDFASRHGLLLGGG